tara:strand:+ start:107 stop:925 length:819 start_codon:yes stop_codon:yes gene_type:complete
MFNTKSAPMTSAQVQNGQEVNKVYKTSDLTIFKQIKGNRPPNPQHVRRLSDSILLNGMLCNPILVNENMIVIDGQHRLLASININSPIYYIILDGYSLNEVHTLNLNQKNWTKKDFMDGYANMGIESYIKLKKFIENNEDFMFSDCVGLCSQLTGGSKSSSMSNKYRADGTVVNQAEVFEEGTWIGKDFKLAQEMANKIRMIQPYYTKYNKSIFVSTLVGLLQNEKFDFNEFMHKLRLQPTALVDCVNRDQYRTLIEDIYNWRSRSKISLKY